MPILNNLTVNEIVSGVVPGYYVWRIVDAQGQLLATSNKTGQTTFSTSPATNVGASALSYVLYNRAGMGNIAVDCSSLTQVSGQRAFGHAFALSGNTPSFDFSNLTIVSGMYAFENAWESNNTTALPATMSFPALQEITGMAAFQNAWQNCAKITRIEMPSLVKVGNNALFFAFGSSSITSLVLGGTAAITLGATTPFNNMFLGCFQDIDVYAPAANQAAIEAMSDYPAFGGYGTVTWHWRS